MIGATGDDKVNLVVSLLAKTEFSVNRVVARINHPSNEWLFTEAWGVDHAVSTPRVIAALVEEAVEVGDLVRLFGLREGQANLVEVTLPDSAPVAGKCMRDLDLPKDAALVAIIRGQRVITPDAGGAARVRATNCCSSRYPRPRPRSAAPSSAEAALGCPASRGCVVPGSASSSVIRVRGSSWRTRRTIQ